MNIFETVKAAVTVKQAAEYCVLSVNRNNMVSCPFRNDRHPSMKLNEDYFYCFGCGTSGDVIDLVAKLFNLSCSEAVAKLAEDFGIGSDKPPSAGARAIPKYDLDVSQPESGCAGVLRDYIHLLETWKKDYAPADYGGDFDNRYAEACRELDYMQELVDKLHDEYGWSDSVSNLSAKLQRQSIRYREVVELAEALGYELIWKRND